MGEPGAPASVRNAVNDGSNGYTYDPEGRPIVVNGLGSLRGKSLGGAGLGFGGFFFAVFRCGGGLE